MIFKKNINFDHFTKIIYIYYILSAYIIIVFGINYVFIIFQSYFKRKNEIIIAIPIDTEIIQSIEQSLDGEIIHQPIDFNNYR
jgi:hypothetical protein